MMTHSGKKKKICVFVCVCFLCVCVFLCGKNERHIFLVKKGSIYCVHKVGKSKRERWFDSFFFLCVLPVGIIHTLLPLFFTRLNEEDTLIHNHEKRKSSSW